MQFNSPTDAALYLQQKLIAGDIEAVQSFRTQYAQADSVLEQHAQMLPYYVFCSANTDMYEYALSSDLLKGISYSNTPAEQQQLNLVCGAVCKTNDTFLNIMSWASHQLQKEKIPDYKNYKTQQVFDYVLFIAAQYFVVKEDTAVMQFLLENARSNASQNYVLLHNSALNFDKPNMLNWLYQQKNIENTGKQHDVVYALKTQKNNLCMYFDIGQEHILFGNNLQINENNQNSIISIALENWNSVTPYFSQLIEKDFHCVAWDEKNTKTCMQLLKTTHNYHLAQQLGSLFIQAENNDAIKLLKKTKFEDTDVKNIIKNVLFTEKLQKTLPIKTIKSPTRKI